MQTEAVTEQVAGIAKLLELQTQAAEAKAALHSIAAAVCEAGTAAEETGIGQLNDVGELASSVSSVLREASAAQQQAATEQYKARRQVRPEHDLLRAVSSMS